MLNQVPEGTVSLSYIRGEPISVGSNLRSIDFSYKKEENLVASFGREELVPVSGGSITLQNEDYTLSSRSKITLTSFRATPLYYKYSLDSTHYLYAKEAVSATRPKEALRESIELIDRFGRPLNYDDWDLDYTLKDSTNGTYEVTIYTKDKPTSQETWRVRYNSWLISTGVIQHSRVEVLDLVKENNLDAELTVALPDSSYYAPAVGLIYKGTNADGDATLSGTDLQLELDAGGTSDYSVANPVNIVSLCESINNADIEWAAIPLTEDPEATLTFATATVAAGVPHVYRYTADAKVRYNSEIKIRAYPPYEVGSARPWYPRITKGQFGQILDSGDFPDDADSLTNAYYLFDTFPEWEAQTFSSNHGSPYIDIRDEPPTFLTDKILKTARSPIKTGSIVLYDHAGVDISSTISDVDHDNGIIYLSSRPAQVSGLLVDYAYEEKFLVYTGIDLNPVLNNDILDKYVGIYMTPKKVYADSSGVPGSLYKEFEQSVFHVIRDTVDDIETSISGLRGLGGSGGATPWDPKAFLVAVFQVTRTKDSDSVNVLDTRVRGGTPKEEYFGGRPMNINASVVIEYPEEVLGTGELPIELTPQIDSSGLYIPSGMLLEEELEDIIKERYLSAGVIPLMERSSDL